MMRGGGVTKQNTHPLNQEGGDNQIISNGQSRIPVREPQSSKKTQEHKIGDRVAGPEKRGVKKWKRLGPPVG